MMPARASLPWMPGSDDRDDPRGAHIVDLCRWPADLPLHPLPPVPVLAHGPADHPQAGQADLRLDDAGALAHLADRISRNPLASAVLVQLLRATEHVAADQALVLESLAYASLQAGAEHAAWLSRRPRTVSPPPPGALRMRRDGDRLALLIDRPGAGNAIDRPLRDALFEAFALAALDHDIAGISLRARGRCFSLGAELAEFGTTTDPALAHAIRARTLPARPLLQRPGLLDVHVQGACVGAGLELAAFARRLTATPRAWFQLPETAMGILPGFGGTVSVTRRIGRQRAALLMLSGRRIPAATALRWGLIDAIVPEPD